MLLVVFLRNIQRFVVLQATDTISELEQHIAHLKVSLEKLENERQRQVRVSELVLFGVCCM